MCSRVAQERAHPRCREQEACPLGPALQKELFGRGSLFRVLAFLSKSEVSILPMLFPLKLCLSWKTLLVWETTFAEYVRSGVLKCNGMGILPAFWKRFTLPVFFKPPHCADLPRRLRRCACRRARTLSPGPARGGV